MKIEKLLLSASDSVLLQGEFQCHRCSDIIIFTLVTQDIGIDVHKLVIHLHNLHLENCRKGTQIPIDYVG